MSKLESEESPDTSLAEQTFERLRDRVATLAVAQDASRRDLIWADSGRSIGLARDPKGQIELFVMGDELVASMGSVRDRLEYQRWFVGDGEPFDANRLVLPSAAHFDAVTALICVELLDNGFHQRPQEAFRATEPVIDLALKRAGLGNEHLVGLIGELLLLDALLRVAPSGSAHDLFSAWFGFKPSSRDFQLATVGVEVKTTTGPTSSHVIHGVSQVEPGQAVEGVQETSLFLVSLGLRWLDDPMTGGSSLPDLVDAILGRLADDDDRKALLAAVRAYGGDSVLGYDHVDDRNRRRFRRRFELKFERSYDMLDDAIRVLRSEQLDGLTHIEAGSVSYRVNLPNQVRGDLNPRAGLDSIAKYLVGKFVDGG